MTLYGEGTAMMRTLLGGVGITALLIAAPLSTANAADMPLKAPPIVAAPAFSWTGCYVGAHAGYGWGRNTNDFGNAIASGATENEGFPAEFGPFNHNTSGGVAGGQAGCNYQPSPNWLIGVEGELFWSGIKGSSTAPEDGVDPGAFSRFQSSNRWDGDFALRAGFVSGVELFYGKVGVAVGSFKYTETHDDFPTTHSCFLIAPGSGICSATVNNTRAGLLLGAGWEHAFIGTHWSFKVEYDYINYGSTTIPYPSAAAAIQNFSVKDTKQIVKVGVNFRL
jgi:outer membrane immunogenic protein